jgi:hypothetical protein
MSNTSEKGKPSLSSEEFRFRILSNIKNDMIKLKEKARQAGWKEEEDFLLLDVPRYLLDEKDRSLWNTIMRNKKRLKLTQHELLFLNFDNPNPEADNLHAIETQSDEAKLDEMDIDFSIFDNSPKEVFSAAHGNRKGGTNPHKKRKSRKTKKTHGKGKRKTKKAQRK